MPELPEAETIARKLNAVLAGQRFDRVIHLRRDILRGGSLRAPRWIRGARIECVCRRGKRPIVQLEGGRGIVFFLGMTGHLAVSPARQAVNPHTHLRIALRSRQQELRFSDYRRFGGISFFTGCEDADPPAVADLGLEPLEMSPRHFRNILRRHRRIKALLLDQHLIAGLGNIYCDEALHRAGIHPLAVAGELNEERAANLHRAIKSVLRSAIRHEGTTIANYAHPDGPGDFQKRLRVYGHSGEPCRACGARIVKIVAAGRTTHLCPACQPD